MKRSLAKNHVLKSCIAAAILIFSARIAFCETDDRGPVLSLGFSGSSNDPGWIFRLDPLAGYKFNKHFEIDAGLPVYFVRVPDSETSDGLSSKSGIGNAWIDFKFMLSRSNFYFSSSVHGTAPTGSSEDGFSTGRATVDWSNYFEYSFDRFAPFGSIGVANTISDTHFFSRPFTSLGLVGHFEGGMLYEPARWLGVGGSGYAVAPSGEQKIYSKIVQSSAAGSGAGTGGSAGAGRGKGQNSVFETVFMVSGTEEIAKDHGFSAWVDVMPNPNVALELGYSRSVSYDYNSVFFSVRFDFSDWIKGKSR